MTPRPRHLQHQGRRRQDLGGGQPRLPRRATTAPARCCGTSIPQGASTYLFRVKPKVKGGGRKLVRGKSDVRRADQGHRPRAPGPAAGRLLLPPHGPRARRHQAPDAPAGARARAARRRLRLHLPRLPAEHLAGLRERVRGRRRAARAADPGDAVLAHVRAARAASSEPTAPQVLAFFSMVDAPQAPAPRGDGAAHRRAPRRAADAIPAAADVERMGAQRTAIGGVRAPQPRRARLRGAVGTRSRERLAPERLA